VGVSQRTTASIKGQSETQLQGSEAALKESTTSQGEFRRTACSIRNRRWRELRLYNPAVSMKDDEDYDELMEMKIVAKTIDSVR
jgi:hypothetical protein